MHKLVVRPLSRHLQPFKKCLPSLAFFANTPIPTKLFTKPKRKIPKVNLHLEAFLDQKVFETPEQKVSV